MFSLQNDISLHDFYPKLAVQCLVCVTFTLFTALQSGALPSGEWKWKNCIVGSSVAKWLTLPYCPVVIKLFCYYYCILNGAGECVSCCAVNGDSESVDSEVLTSSNATEAVTDSSQSASLATAPLPPPSSAGSEVRNGDLTSQQQQQAAVSLDSPIQVRSSVELLRLSQLKLRYSYHSD